MTSSPRSLALLAAGAVAIAASLAWSWINPPSGAWTDDKAAKLQTAQSTLHRLGGHGEELTRPLGQSAADTEAAKESNEYRDALAMHQTLRAELTAAQNSNALIARVLLWGGVALVVAGWLTTRGQSSN